MIKCLVCGSHVPKEVAVELTLEGKLQDFCSVGCADAALAEGAALAPPPSPPVPRRILVAVDGSGPSSARWRQPPRSPAWAMAMSVSCTRSTRAGGA
jgi:hypothetical protein